jgi:hypothetical protein
MSENVKLSKPPGIDTKNLKELKVLEVELFGLEAQIRNFGSLRDRLSAAGKDATVYFRNMEARRAKVIAALKQLRPTPPKVAPTPGPLLQPGDALTALPLAPARFITEIGGFGFGTSGFVQMPLATDGVNVVPHGKYPSSGEFENVAGAYPGNIYFQGLLNVGPDELPSGDQYDPSLSYVWLRTWKYLVPFPPPTGYSRFTYRFDVSALANLFTEASAGMVFSFVTLGETANLMQGIDVVANIDGGWPLQVDVTQPGPLYNGHYGIVTGQVTVQRSFLVEGFHVPGVAIIVGIAAALPMMSDLNFSIPFEGYSGIGVNGGRISYHYEPQLVIHP